MTLKQAKMETEQVEEKKYERKPFTKLTKDITIEPISIKFGESKYGEYLILKEKDITYITSAKRILNFFDENKFERGNIYRVYLGGVYKGYDVLEIKMISQSKLEDF